MRIGISEDIHRLVEGKELVLGGVTIPSNKGSLAHSDGDVLIHAIVDAIIGALAKGDIGELFPDNDQRYKNIRSTYFLEVMKELLKKEGYEIINIDSLVVLEAPKLKNYKVAIKESIATYLNIDSSKVNVKAGTNEGLDSLGRGESIKAHAVVLLRKVK